MENFKKIVSDCLEEGIDNTSTDYISLEKVTVDLDEDGEIEEILDILEVVAEFTIHEPPEN